MAGIPRLLPEVSSGTNPGARRLSLFGVVFTRDGPAREFRNRWKFMRWRVVFVCRSELCMFKTFVSVFGSALTA